MSYPIFNDLWPDPELVGQAFRTAGAVILRCPERDLAAFMKLSGQLGSKFVELGTEPGQYRNVGGTRPAVGLYGSPSLFAVSDPANGDEIPLHGELYFQEASPPEVLWFYCQQPASSGGETWLADGRAIFRSLPETLQQRLQEQALLYKRSLPKEGWQKVFGFEQADELAHWLDSKGFDFRFEPDGSLSTGFESPALRGQATETAFINNLLPFGLRQLREPDKTRAQVCWANGKPLAEADLLALEAQANQFRKSLSWQQGDLLLIDNTRTLHGRPRIEDSRRSIFVRMSAKGNCLL